MTTTELILVVSAIAIGFASSALFVVLASRRRMELGYAVIIAPLFASFILCVCMAALGFFGTLIHRGGIVAALQAAVGAGGLYGFGMSCFGVPGSVAGGVFAAIAIGFARRSRRLDTQNRLTPPPAQARRPKWFNHSG